MDSIMYNYPVSITGSINLPKPASREANYGTVYRYCNSNPVSISYRNLSYCVVYLNATYTYTIHAGNGDDMIYDIYVCVE